MTDCRGKSVLITGAASGIGRLMADRIAEQGARLVLWDVNEQGLAATASALQRHGYQITTYALDLTDRAAIRETGKRVLQDVGTVDVLINNAGVVYGKPFLDASDEEIERTFAVNALALFWTARVFLPGMLERDRGHIVNVASAGGLVGTPRMTDYCASKFAAVGFDEALRLELRHRGSRVKTTVVCPYYISTGMFEGVRTRFPRLLPILKPEDVANRVVKALNRNHSRVVMPWFVYAVWPTRLLPVAAFDALMAFFGITMSMDQFRGRDKQDEADG